MNIGIRIKMLREQKDLSQEDLAKLVGYKSKTSIHKIEQGLTDLPLSKVSEFAEVLNTTSKYLMGWDEQQPHHPTTDYSKYGLISLENRRTKKVPILGDIACGIPIYAEETYDDYIEVDEDIRVDFALRTKGDSMIGDNIVDGDIVLVKKVSMVEPHEIAVVVINDEATLKRVRYDRKNNIVMLEASNPNVPVKLYVGEELERINILGKAVLLQRKL